MRRILVVRKLAVAETVVKAKHKKTRRESGVRSKTYYERSGAAGTMRESNMAFE
jgi:hypothetical protein